MRHFDYSTSRKMAELGCVSSSGFRHVHYHSDIGHDDWYVIYGPMIDYKNVVDFYNCFIPQDFLDTTEQARRNCEIIFKHETLKSDYPCIQSRISTHKIIDSDDAIKFITDIVEGL